MTTTSVTSGTSLSSLLNTGSSSASSSTTGTLSSAGLGSGLDVDAIVTALVNDREAGPQAQITNKATQTNATLTGLTTLNRARSRRAARASSGRPR